MSIFRRLRDCRSGATAIEFALVGPLLILISIGVVDFGRALYVKNTIAYAVDVGTRKVLTNATISNSSLESTIRSAFKGPSSNLLQIAISSAAIGGVNYRVLTINYPFVSIVPGFTASPITLTTARSIPLI